MGGTAHARLRVVLGLVGLGLALCATALTLIGAPPVDSARSRDTDLAVTGLPAQPVGDRALGALASLTDQCGSPNPFLATSRFVDAVHATDLGARPVLFAFRDTVDELPTDQVTLGTYGQVGTVYGLAFDDSRQHLYAAAFLKRGSLFPPGGPGAISRIDLATGEVTRFASLPAGPASLHRLVSDADSKVVPWIGRASLGDIDIDAPGSTLFAANLYDGRIYRLALANGSVIGSFANGAASLAWGGGARPFGLAVQGSYLYHGVVESIGTSQGTTVPIGHVYRSRADGSDLREVAAFPLDPLGAEAPTEPWLADDQPVISDIIIRPDGEMVIAIRNLALDATLGDLPPRLGDVLPAIPDGTGWRVELTPERYVDSLAGLDEALTGGLAQVFGLDFTVAAGHTGVINDDAAGAVWFDASTGNQERIEILGPEGENTSTWLQPGTGDIEVLCRPNTPLDPDKVAGATSDAARIATGTAAAAATSVASWATARLSTMTAVVPTLTAYAPTHADLATAAARITVAPARATAAAGDYQRLVDSCNSDDPCFAIAHQIAVRANVPRMPRDAVTAFNQVDPLMALADSRSVGSVHGLAYDIGRAHLYAAAFNPRFPGPAGSGAIYRVALDSGRIVPWAALPTLRGSPRRFGPGDAGFGDIDLDDDATQLFAVNLYDRHIYRLSVPDGALLGVFTHGATGETWGADGLPFALGFRDGWLYHGVAPDLDRPRPKREAVIYRSRPDGTEMSEVARVALNYRVLGQAKSHASAFPVDIDFRSNGEAVLGLRDRLDGLSGDLLPAHIGRNGWTVTVDREHYDDKPWLDESVTGSIAVVPLTDRLVGAAASVRSRLDTGALWFDNVTGAMLFRRQLEPGKTSIKCDPQRKCSVFQTYEVLGDLEVLCPEVRPTPSPRPSPTSAPTPSETSTLTPTATASPTPTPTRTPTQIPEPVYLPLALNEDCDPTQLQADVALVIDASTSMQEETREGRTKLAAAVEAVELFLGELNLQLDQAAVVQFNGDVELLQELTGDGGALADALARIQVKRQTRIDLGVKVAREELASSRRRPGNQAVMIVLTDGKANPVGPDAAVREAEAAKAEQITIFTIGLGKDLDLAALEAIASKPSYFYRAPDAEDLADIYSMIAIEIPCPATDFWGRR